MIATYLLHGIAEKAAGRSETRMDTGGGGRNRTGVHGFAVRRLY
jgi:hypothetical protein